ncbi:MAG: 3-deoxy-D-manno-octulosonic acid transferase [Fibrella sp.]|nr:3-deoxy-D-manno-octulosonic acid transferase [Armatimonadota bacterium]
MAIFFYNLLLLLLFPVVLLVYGYRIFRGKESVAHLAERCGRYDPSLARDPHRPRFWVHAVSVGEVMAATPVLKELRLRHPGAMIVLSVTTTGGREVAQSKVPPADHVVYFPLDFPLSVRNAVRTIRPDLLILMEWEIWPNLLSAAKQHGATVAVVNGRISDKGLKRGAGVKWFLASALRCVDVLAMQSAEDARRAMVVGANPSTVHTVGNTKFDESATMLSPAERAELRRDFGIPDGNDVFICGSTRDAPEASDPDEEDLIMEAVMRLYLVHAHNNLSIIIAPRHLERADAIAKRLAESGDFTVRRRSESPPPRGMPNTRHGDIWLLDTFGELARAYAIADVAFVGGSLVQRGGQSVFQPLAQGVPAVFGPHMNNQRDIAALAQAEGVGFLVRDANELAETVHRILTLSPEEKTTLAAKSRSLIERNQGVTARALDLISSVRENPFGE